MRKKLWGLSLSLWLFPVVLAASEAEAASLDLILSNSEILVGNPVTVEVKITGLGDMTSPSVSTFDLDIDFDAGILAFESVAYGDPLLGDQLDLFGLGSFTQTTSSDGQVNIFELSFDLSSDLNALQAESFILATLNFETLAIGNSPLDLSVNSLGDAFGLPLTVESISNTSVTVVPEPLTFLGTGTATVFGAFFKRELSKKKKNGKHQEHA